MKETSEEILAMGYITKALKAILVYLKDEPQLSLREQDKLLEEVERDLLTAKVLLESEDKE